MVMEKHRDIAILMSMGARASQIRNIFVFEGALIGAVGTDHRPRGRLHVVLFSRSLQAGSRSMSRFTRSPYVPFEPQAFDGLWIAARGDGREPARDALSGAQRHPDRPGRIATIRIVPQTDRSSYTHSRSQGKILDEYIGRVNSGDAQASIAHMRSPAGWSEPGQRPEFDEFTLVLSGDDQWSTKAA